MGMIQVKTWGSFPSRDITIKAQDHGHAVAVLDAIKMLKDQFLPVAIEQDKKLRSQGHGPDDDFEEADKLGVLK